MGFSSVIRTVIVKSALEAQEEENEEMAIKARMEQLLSKTPTSVDEYIDQHYAKLDERDQQQQLDADMILGDGGHADGAGTGGQD